jgi:hypothetical protein
MTMALIPWNPNDLGGKYAARAGSGDNNRVDHNDGDTQTMIDSATGKLYQQTWQSGPRGDEWVSDWSQPVDTGKLFSNDPVELKMLQAGYQPMGGGVWSTKSDFGAGNQYVMAPSALARTDGGGSMFQQYAIGNDPTTGATVLNPNINPGEILTKYRNSIYTGGDTIGDFLGNYGPALLMAGGLAGAAGGFASGFGGAAPAAGPTGLSAIYNTGAGGFGAPLTALESATPIISGVEAAGAVGNLGTLAGTGGLTPLADAAAAGGGDSFASSVGYGANAGTGTGSVSNLATGVTSGAPATSTAGFNINDPSTWPNINTPTGTGLNNTNAPADLLNQYTSPLPNTGGLPSSGNVVDLANSGNMTTGVNSTATGSSTLSSLTDAAKKSALDRIMNGTGTAADYAKLAGAGIDAFGALNTFNRQNQLWDAGAASRDRFNAGMQPGFDINSIPGYKAALDTSSDAFTRSLSAKGGNPMGTGSAQAETQKYLMGTVGLPAWNNYQSLNANVGFGGPTTGAANSSQNLTSALGQGIGTLTQPSNDLASQLGNLSQLNEFLKKNNINAGDIFTTDRALG